jgi:hypothetical protein
MNTEFVESLIIDILNHHSNFSSEEIKETVGKMSVWIGDITDALQASQTQARDWEKIQKKLIGIIAPTSRYQTMRNYEHMMFP